MRTLRLLIAVVLLGFSSCIEKTEQLVILSPDVGEISASELTLKPEKGLLYFNELPFTGTSVKCAEDGQLVESIDYLNGKKSGLFKRWYNSGQISFEAKYLDGKRQGESRSYWRNGRIRSSSNFENGTAHGLQKQWYKSGAIFKRSNLNMGREEGLQQAWRENGKLYVNYEAKDGRIYGLKRAALCFQLESEKYAFEN